MSQSNVIFFFLFAAFFVFITMRGELPKYMGFLLASPATGSQGGGSGATSSALSYNSAGNAQSTVSADIGNAAITGAKIAAAF